ncbi:aldehyde dehydrogenase family protein [Syntrophotalea acetylenica]|uniref:Aldehyde dehydrogenase domain-containing protein n=1 Tax=Syntrophotalea acetylenica TaxID=29542 RepID=A0A1L3GDC4_SYNAC|nr:aldehyde dehydrogenase family protein [Syntrophotalea acetylenica]APG23952.1 hypothetical protein A7E75_02125 [Syntrophotalea acetylenica]APG44534.1 hypothetical protein A6070_10745 [Syntrophotalea acetylenica]
MKSTIDCLVANAQEALKSFSAYSQEQVDHIVESMVAAGVANAERLGQMAYEETLMGVVGHKVAKNMAATQVVGDYLRDKKSVGVIGEEDGVIQIAEPFGVIAALTPTTNPTSTILFKAIIALKGRNTVVFAFHPRGQQCGVEAARLMLNAAVEAGAPKNCIQWIAEPSVEATSYLIKHPGTSLILATGGKAMVHASYTSGHPAYGVGPGNVPAYIEKSANLEQTTDNIILSKTFDNGVICASEQNLIFDDQKIADATLEKFKEKGAYIVNEEEKAKLAEAMFDQEKNIPVLDVVGRSAAKVAEFAGFRVPEETTVILVPLDDIGAGDLLSGEKLSPVLGYVVVDSREKAIQLACEMLEFKGAGHSAAIHTCDDKAFEEYALAVPAGRILMNQPSVLGAVGGEYNNLLPTFTLGCGARGGNSTSDNIQYFHLLNIKRAAKPKN